LKGAVFIHGWATDRHVWHKYWLLDNGMPMPALLEDLGYSPIILEMPGIYLERDKDFHWYSRYLGHVIREREDLDEIILIGHSMGGIVARNYLTLEDDIFSEGQMRTRKLISLGTPNHGTSVPHFDTISRFLATIADFVLPFRKDLTVGAEHNYFLNTPCYRDIQLGSGFLHDLNSRTIPDHISSHVIWTSGDSVADPAHTCVLPGSINHLVDKVMVNHFNMCYREEVLEVVKDIISGKDRPEGLQSYPPINGCAHPEGHEWLPDTGMVSREGLNIWRCASCGEIAIKHALPLQLACRAPGAFPAIHRWTLSGRFFRYRFRCARCGNQVWHPQFKEIYNHREKGRDL
jgi:hypothetical protein